ncbi:MAG: UDP-N-acetylmuramoyl-L-alanine--D-glutamate ligase, partial [Propionibacteriaceae bacterium]|nr:UDP-N-acetylmuramoyl-L-alanine--D-glutamate ligase [Propionibacteriaceae bacterium]
MIESFNRLSDWSQVSAVVAGLGASGYAAADALLELGAEVLVVDDADNSANRERATILEILGAQVRLGPGASAADLERTGLLIASPGWQPSNPLLRKAISQELPIWGEVELAWRLMQPDRAVPWLAVTGTNGKTTTVNMLESILAADGRRVAAVGNIGRTVIEAVQDEVDYEVFAVELSSFQLHWINSVSLHSAAVLNVQPDHLEWYAAPEAWRGGTVSPLDAYAFDKGQVYQRVQHAAVYNLADDRTEQLVEEADVVEGARAIAFTTGIPGPSMLGVVDDLLVDRAFIPQRRDSAIEVAKLSDVVPYAPHNVQNALAAAALARSFGVRPQAVAQGLRQLQLGDHRIQQIAEV